MTARRRWGFRARLAALIAGVFIVGGAVLLAVQYLLVQQLFTQGLQTITADCRSGDGASDSSCSIETGDATGIVVGSDTGSVVIQQTTQLSQEVLSGLLIWSVVVLVLFAGLAVLVAWWLSQRSLGRIARITQTTRAITRDDLHRRLALPGPRDEIKELGDTIDGMLDRLDDAFQRQDRFIAGASHELRTPLTTTRTLLEIPLAQGRFPSDVEPEVRGALAANERSEQLIAALLALAGTGRSRGEPTSVDLAALARASVVQHADEAEERGMAVSLTGGPIRIRTDEVLTTIAIGNVVENAIRHGRAGGAVRIAAVGDAAVAALVIENEGEELDSAVVARLTEPFHRGAQSRISSPGSGLGLTLADAAARSLGGVLTLAPRRGGGLVARLAFPLVAPSEPPLTREPHRDDRPAPPSS